MRFTRKIHTKLHPGSEWRTFHIFTCEDVNDVISRFSVDRCAKSHFAYKIKRKLHGGLRQLLFSHVNRD